MRAVVVFLLLALGLATAPGCTTTRDCCECLAEAGELTCTGTRNECVDGCVDVCDAAEACYCTAARRADCAAECGCEALW